MDKTIPRHSTKIITHFLPSASGKMDYRAMSSRAMEEPQTRVEAKLALTNEPLSDSEAYFAQLLSTGVAKEIDSVDADISALHKFLDNLKDRRQGLQSRLAKLRSGAHRKIPLELLTKIFRYCSDEVLELPPERSQIIWTIIQVCSRWRNVAIADPWFWCRLNLFTTYKQDHRLISLTHDILCHRGGGGKVSYSVYTNGIVGWLQTLSLLCEYHARINSLKLHLGFILDTDNICIEAPSPDEEAHESPAQSYNSVMYPTTRVTNPWPYLSHIDIYRITISQLTIILNHTTQLISCKVSLTGSIHPNISQELIRMDSLQLLIITEGHCAGISEFLGCFVLPKLKSLKLGHLKEWPQAAILQLVKQSKCALEVFETEECVLAVDLLSLLDSMPDLVELEIYLESSTADSILNEMMVMNLVPKLRRLKGQWSVRSLHSFVDFLQSRWTGPEEGISEASVICRASALDEQYLQDILNKIKQDGRKITLRLY
ncbi:hypothetical protein BDZ94DRAFT_1323224 [Collybia nuda]|uniref:F-box domain-containing protein n=1 Tax=Collybia nuda TaxID=64659 RepID=A0A9P5Y3L9_9AGAR|nr:hypothetical protein BDZ94DRAFT_1323224 [Collybia nuda]